MPSVCPSRPNISRRDEGARRRESGESEARGSVSGAIAWVVTGEDLRAQTQVSDFLRQTQSERLLDGEKILAS